MRLGNHHFVLVVHPFEAVASLPMLTGPAELRFLPSKTSRGVAVARGWAEGLGATLSPLPPADMAPSARGERSASCDTERADTRTILATGIVQKRAQTSPCTHAHEDNQKCNECVTAKAQKCSVPSQLPTYRA